MIVTIHHETEPAQTYGPIHRIDVDLGDGQRFMIRVQDHLLAVSAGDAVLVLPVAVNEIRVEAID